MSTNELERVSSDLTTIRQAMRLDKGYAWDDVTREFVTAGCGLLSCLLMVFSELNYRVAFVLGMVPMLVYYYFFMAKRRKSQAERPNLWFEEKLVLKALAIVMPFLIGWLAWSKLSGIIDLRSAGASTVFFMGIGLGYVALVDINRRRYLAGSLTLMAFGLAIPSLTQHQTAVGVAASLIVASLGEAAIIMWQLKHDGRSSVGTD